MDSFTSSFSILNNTTTSNSEELSEKVSGYSKLYDGARTGKSDEAANVSTRKERYHEVVNTYYDLVTDFYEYGWGQSFHFAQRFQGESFLESIYRAEHYLAMRLNLSRDKKVIDCGCGVGGPLRNIARFSGATLEGVTINQYQVNVGNRYGAAQGLSDVAHLTQSDFHEMPFKDGEYDAAYAIEATCHSPDRTKCFSEINRVLKTGALFGGYEWAMTSDYDPTDPEQVRIKEGIEEGNGIPTLTLYTDVLEALKNAGFEIIDHFDANANHNSLREIPWYSGLQSSNCSLKNFRMTPIGRFCTHIMVWTLETLRIAPKGTTAVASLLAATAHDLVAGGSRGIFTPGYFFLARKIKDAG